MKKTIAISLTLLAAVSLWAQYPQDLPVGLYKDLESVLKKRPSHSQTLEVKKRTDHELFWREGSDYKITTEDSMGYYADYIRDAYAAYDGKTLYINGLFVSGRKHYCKVENNQRFLVVTAGIPFDSRWETLGFTKIMRKNDFLPIGDFADRSAEGKSKKLMRFYYIVDMETSEVKALNVVYLDKLLNDYPEVKQAFQSDSRERHPFLLYEYLQKLAE